jgi:hypothetical protein
MITPSFGITSTERVLPRLALDFTTASLDPRVTFTRAGNTATVVNSSGFVEPINADLPRFDFDPVTLACKGLLIEENRSNIVLQSNTLTTTWSGVRASATLVTVTTPDGAASGYKIIEDTQTGGHFLRQTGTFSVGTYTYSVYLKAAERTWARLQIGGTTFGIADFDLGNGVVGTTVTAGFTRTITNAGNGWYRCTITGSASALATNICAIFTLLGDNNASYTGVDGFGIYAYGAQLEAGAFATSYIPTEASQVTRTADVATMTGTNFSDWFNASEGAFVVDYTPYSPATNPNSQLFFDLHDTTASNRLRAFRSATANNASVLSTASGTTNGSITLTQIAANARAKIAVGYKADDLGMALNGGNASVDSAVTVPTATQLNIGCSNTNANQLAGHYQKLLYYPQRLINAELSAFSK